jgi:uncharacterized membrane protein
MKDEKGKSRIVASPAFRIASLAILTALTAVFTYIVRVPIARTGGYLNLGDVIIYFTAFTFGPVSALIAGGLGTAITDLISGYSQWAPISLFAHGLQGLVAGLIASISWRGKDWIFNPFWLVAVVAGTVVMAGGYLAAQTLMLGIGAALFELPWNLLQNLIGVVGAIPLTIAVRKAYPPVAKMRW